MRLVVQRLRFGSTVMSLAATMGCGATSGPPYPSRPPEFIDAPSTRSGTTALEALAHVRRLNEGAPLVRISTEGVDIPVSGRIQAHGVWFLTFATTDRDRVSQWRIDSTGKTIFTTLSASCFFGNGVTPSTMAFPVIDSGRALELALPSFVEHYGPAVSAGSSFNIRYVRGSDGSPHIQILAPWEVRRHCNVDRMLMSAMTGEILVVSLGCLNAPSMIPVNSCRGY